MYCAKPEARVLALGFVLGGLLNLTLGQPAARSAESPLTRIARTGRLIAGTRTDAVPFAYRDSTGAWTGYSIDLLERIRAAVQRQVKRPVQLELVDADSGSLDLLSQGKVDLVCGSTSYSRSRDLQADFSVGYFVTGTQMLINTEHEVGTEFIIGVIANTTNQQLMQKLFPIAQFVTVESRAVGLQGLENQRIDALASDGILLEAMRLSLLRDSPSSASAYAVVPNQPYDQQSYACMLPQGDKPFQQLVNSSLLTFMQGVLAAEPADLNTLETWFGAEGKVPISLEARTNLLKYFQQQIDLPPVP